MGEITQTYLSDLTDEFGDLLGEDGQYVHQYDAQAQTNALLDDTGQVAAAYKYTAFGQVAAVSVDGGPWSVLDTWAHLTADQWSSMTTEAWSNLPVDFTTHMLAGGQKQYYHDAETELYLLGMGNNAGGGRYYDQATARFMSEDPLRQSAGDDNLYRYVGNDPVNRVDPSGRQADPYGYSVNKRPYELDPSVKGGDAKDTDDVTRYYSNEGAPLGIWYRDVPFQRGNKYPLRRYFYEATYHWWYRSVSSIGSVVIMDATDDLVSLLKSHIQGLKHAATQAAITAGNVGELIDAYLTATMVVDGAALAAVFSKLGYHIVITAAGKRLLADATGKVFTEAQTKLVVVAAAKVTQDSAKADAARLAESAAASAAGKEAESAAAAAAKRKVEEEAAATAAAAAKRQAEKAATDSQAAFDDLANWRREMHLGEPGSAVDGKEYVLSRVDVAGEKPIYGINWEMGHSRPPGVSYQFLRHAEGDALSQAAKEGVLQGQRVTLYVDKMPCQWCRRSFANFAKEHGIEELKVITPKDPYGTYTSSTGRFVLE